MTGNTAKRISENGYQKGSDTLTNRENERKNSMTIPMTEELKAAITEAAREAGMTRATWVRSELIKILKEEK